MPFANLRLEKIEETGSKREKTFSTKGDPLVCAVLSTKKQILPIAHL